MFLRLLFFAAWLIALMYFASIGIPKIKKAKAEYEFNCPCKEFHVGQMVTIKIDGRTAIINSKYCFTLELKYFADGRYRYDNFTTDEVTIFLTKNL